MTHNTAEAHSAVDHPLHYNTHPSGVECIDIAEGFGFNLGNVIKYLWRADEKGAPLEDLLKAQWYLKREISRRQPNESQSSSPQDINLPNPAASTKPDEGGLSRRTRLWTAVYAFVVACGGEVNLKYQTLEFRQAAAEVERIFYEPRSQRE